MKKQFLTTLGVSILTVTCAIAQPTILGTFFGVKNTKIKQVYDATGGNLDVPVGGTSAQNWDYSTKFTNPDDTATSHLQPLSNSLYSPLFPDATHALKWENGPFQQGDSTWQFLKIDTTGLNVVGAYSERKAIDTALYYTNPFHYVPHVVNQTTQNFNDIAVSEVYKYVGLNLGKQVTTRTASSNYTGFGSLTTPVNTFNDVVLVTVKIIDHIIDSADINSDNIMDVELNNKTQTQNEYHFVRNNTFASTHLMILKGDTSGNDIDWGWYTLPVDIGQITGQAFDSTNTPVNNGIAYLYRSGSNFTKNDILDSSIIVGNGNFQFDSIPYGDYRVAVRPNTTNYIGALTTYFGDTTNWLGATIITTNSPTTTGIDIQLQYIPSNTNSNNLVSGNITGLWGFVFSKNGEQNNYILGDPVGGINVSLEQIPGGTIAHQTTTDGAGNYSFLNLPDAKYKVWVDVPGMEMASTYDFDLTGGNSHTNVDFITDLDSIYATNPTSIIEKSNPLSSISGYPNPFNDDLKVIFRSNVNKDLTINITNLLGEQVKSNTLLINKGLNQVEVNTTGLVSGIYFVSLVENGETTHTLKVIKQ